MRVLLASEPGGGPAEQGLRRHRARAVVLLDGAGTCRTRHRLRARHRLVRAHTRRGCWPPGPATTGCRSTKVLGRGIERVSHMHAGTCDLGHPATPGATVIIVRQRGGTLEYLVLCDSVLLLQASTGEPRAITDTKLAEIGPGTGRPGLVPGTPEHDAAWRAYSRELEDARNQPGGYWLAAARPRRRGPRTDRFAPAGRPAAVALLSDGASRLADRFHLATWADLGILAADRPPGLIEQGPGGRVWG